MPDFSQLRDTDKLLVQRDGESYFVTFADFSASQPWFGFWDFILDLITQVDGGSGADESIDRPRPIDNGRANSKPFPGLNGGGAFFQGS